MRWPEIVATTAAAASSAAVAEAATAMIISSKYKLNKHTQFRKRDRRERQQQLLHDVLFQICMKERERLNFRNNRKNRTIY